MVLGNDGHDEIIAVATLVGEHSPVSAAPSDHHCPFRDDSKSADNGVAAVIVDQRENLACGLTV